MVFGFGPVIHNQSISRFIVWKHDWIKFFDILG